MSAMIVGLSVLLGVAFGVLWVSRPDVRQRVERPKHQFQERLRQYDRVNRD